MENILSKKQAKELLMGKNKVQKRAMTPVEQATYMCDHRYDDGKVAIVADKERADYVFCPICRKSWYAKPINKIKQSEAKETLEGMIQMIKLGTPLSDTAALDMAQIMFTIDQLPSYYQTALSTGEVTNKNAHKQTTSRYNKYDEWAKM